MFLKFNYYLNQNMESLYASYSGCVKNF
jgi:hypothetical protein